MATFTSTPNKEYYVRLIVNQTSQNIANNTSTVSWELWVGNGVNTMEYNGQQLSASINGKTVHSSTRQISLLSKNMTVKIASGTETIQHNADGTKTIACSGQWIPTGSYAPSATLTASGNLQLTTIPRASSVSLASSEVAYGSRLTINISRATSSFTHDVTITLPNRTQKYTGVATQQLFDIPLDWLNGYTNGVIASGTVTVQTKSGSTNIGSAVSVNFAAPVPSNIVPTISFTNRVIKNPSGISTLTKPVMTISEVKEYATGSGQYSASIVNTVWRLSGGTGVKESDYVFKFTPNLIDQTIELSVVDSRGRVSTISRTISSLVYTKPSLTLEAYRCDSNGVFKPDGTYIKYKPTYTFTNLDAYNSIYSNWYSIDNNVQSAIQNPLPSGTWSQPVGNGQISKLQKYRIYVTITDKLENTTQRYVEIPIAEVLMNFPSSADALGLGQYSTLSNALEIGWDTYIKGSHVVETIESGTRVAIKFYNGWMIQCGEVNISANTVSVWHTHLVPFNGFNWATCTPLDLGSAIICSCETITSQIKITVKTHTNTPPTIASYVKYIAIGRWK